MEAQGVSVPATPEGQERKLLGFSADGSEYNAQEGDRHVKVGVIGGDSALLRRSLAILRPAALDDSE